MLAVFAPWRQERFIMPESQEQLLALYQRQEMILHEIYATFAVRFPKDSVQWRQMAQDELEHAQWMDALTAAVKQGEASFSEDKVRVNALQTMCNYLEGVLVTVKGGQMDRKKAFFLAVDMEKSLIERNIFKRFSGDSEKISAMLHILEFKQQAHVLAIQHYASLQT
jgi:hypothetical protein